MAASASHARRLVAGNWKMNLDLAEGLALGRACGERLRDSALPVVLCAPAVHLAPLRDLLGGSVRLGAQDVSSHVAGAHTGELSAGQLRSVGCEYVLVGHSERRADHGEGGPLLRGKVDRALEAELRPIYCFGETLAQRDDDAVERVVAAQLSEGLSHLDGDAFGRVVLAYEPVWAIGTGRTASPGQAQAVHAFVRSWVGERFGGGRSEAATILYGGSVKPGNAAELFGQLDIDGGLVGGASLRADDFVAIARAHS